MRSLFVLPLVLSFFNTHTQHYFPMSATRLLRQQWLSTKFTQPLKRWNSTAAGLQVLLESHSCQLKESLIYVVSIVYRQALSRSTRLIPWSLWCLTRTLYSARHSQTTCNWYDIFVYQWLIISIGLLLNGMLIRDGMHQRLFLTASFAWILLPLYSIMLLK